MTDIPIFKNQWNACSKQIGSYLMCVTFVTSHVVKVKRYDYVNMTMEIHEQGKMFETNFLQVSNCTKTTNASIIQLTDTRGFCTNISF